MATYLNPYLSFRDTARQAMEFYQSVFGGELTLSTFGEFHASEDPAEVDKIMHGQLETPGGLVLMGADTPDPHGARAQTATSRCPSAARTRRSCRATGTSWRTAARSPSRWRRPVGRHLRHAQRQVRRPLAGERPIATRGVAGR